MGGLSAITNRRVIYLSRNRNIEEKCILEPEEKVLLYQKQGSTGALNLLLGGVLYLLTIQKLLVLDGGNLSILTSIPLNTITGVSLSPLMSAAKQELALLLNLTSMPQIHQPVDRSSPFGIAENSLTLPLDQLGKDEHMKDAELLECFPRALCQTIKLPFLPPRQYTTTQQTALELEFPSFLKPAISGLINAPPVYKNTPP